MRITLFFRWYDLWVGAYIDRANRAVYVCPIPMFGVKIEWGLGLPSPSGDWFANP